MSDTTNTKLFEEEVTSLRRRVAELEQRGEKLIAREPDFANQLFEITHAIVLVLDSNGRIVRVNRYFEKILGVDFQDLKGKDWFEVCLSEDVKEPTRKDFMAEIDSSETGELVNSLVAANGDVLQIHWYGTTLRNPDGSVSGVLAIGHDVTQKLLGKDALKQAHDELALRVEVRTSELAKKTAQLQAIFNAIPDLVFILNSKGEIIEFQSGRSEDLYTSPDQFLGKRMWDVLPNEVGDLFRSAVEKVHTTEGMESIDYPLTILDREGWFRARVLPYTEEDILVVVEDITERKQAEHESMLSAEIMKNMAEGVCLLRASDGVLVFTNPRFDEMFGYETGELAGQHTAILNAPSDHTPKETADKILQDLEKTGTWSGEIQNIRKDQTPIWTHSSVSTFDHPQHGTVRVAVVEDITERKRTQEQLRQHQENLAHVTRLSTMGEMGTGLAHELNQPLAAIVNYSYSGLRALDNPESANRDQLCKLFEKLGEQAMRASEIIRRLRTLVVKRVSDSSQVDIVEPIQEVLLLMESDFRQNDLLVELQMGHAKCEVTIDEIQIQQVLVNLVRNALDAMSETDRDRRTLKIATSLTDDGFLEVTVCDSGKGVPVESTNQIFDPFFSNKSGGMGMGLAISRTIIESHDGRLWMMPNSDRGVTFHFTIPVSKERQ